jgi:hypothetical protein
MGDLLASSRKCSSFAAFRVRVPPRLDPLLGNMAAPIIYAEALRGAKSQRFVPAARRLASPAPSNSIPFAPTRRDSRWLWTGC